MRRILGPVVLAALVLIALWFLQHDARPATAPAPDRDLAASAPAPMPSTPTTSEEEAESPAAAPESPPARLTSAQGDVDEPVPAPDLAPGDAAVIEAARGVVQSFARPTPGVSQQQWWSRLEPLLSVQARSDYMGVRGSDVGYSRIVADPIVEPAPEGEDSHLSATALVPTDGGTYQVQLITPDGRTWLGTRITLVDDEHTS